MKKKKPGAMPSTRAKTNLMNVPELTTEEKDFQDPDDDRGKKRKVFKQDKIMKLIEKYHRSEPNGVVERAFIELSDLFDELDGDELPDLSFADILEIFKDTLDLDSLLLNVDLVKGNYKYFSILLEMLFTFKGPKAPTDGSNSMERAMKWIYDFDKTSIQVETITANREYWAKEGK